MTFETPDEEILFDLGKSSFLSIWSYSNLYRNQGDVSREGDGKELCDFAVVFGSSVLLFSDKRAEYKNNSDDNVAWNRWHKKAIRKSAEQLKGAQRWMTNYPERIFKDKKCKENLGLHSSTQLTIHNIVVTHGLEAILQAQFGEASFSYTNKSESKYTINQQSFESELFFHVFTGESLQFLISQIDTTKDFIEYLEQRKSAFSRKAELYVQKESDLVHMYYKSDDSIRTNHLDAAAQNSNPICTYYNGIDGLLGDSIYAEKRRSDKISFFWDRLIEHFAEHALEGTLVGPIGNNLSETEIVLRRLAETSRLERRQLADAFWEKWVNTRVGQRGMRILLSKNSCVLYVFLFLPDEKFDTNEEYRNFRRGLVADYAFVLGEENREYAEIICLGAKTNWQENTNFSLEIIAAVILEGLDFCMMDNSDWSHENIEEAKRIRSELVEEGLLTPDQRKYKNSSISEF